MGTRELKHKILSVAEEAGVADAAYALKLLQSDGRLRIATVGKDSGTGRPRTQHYEVEGPVAMLLTTTAERPDEELANRCLVVSANEHPRHTAAIHDSHRTDYLPAEESPIEDADREACRRRHHHAQRLLQPLRVVMPFARQLTFRTDQTRYRRDHAKYLSLIATGGLMHQYQRPRTTCQGDAASWPRSTMWLWPIGWPGRRCAYRPISCCRKRSYCSRNWRPWSRSAPSSIASRHEVRFTQRQLRETLHWNDRALRRQLTRLVELEYVVAYRTGHGNGRMYQLLYEPRRESGSSWQLGLSDVEQLRTASQKLPGSLLPGRLTPRP